MSPKQVKRFLNSRIKGYFFTGLLVLAPLALTIYVVFQLFVIIDGLLSEYVTSAIFKSLGIVNEFGTIPGLGILALILLILVVGFIAKNYFGKKLFSWSELLLHRIPVVRHIYSTFQQISQAFYLITVKYLNVQL